MSHRRLIVVSAVVMGVTLLTLWLLLRWSFGTKILAGIGMLFTVWSIINLLPLDPELATAADEARKREAVELMLKPVWIWIVVTAVAAVIVWAASALWNFIR